MHYAQRYCPLCDCYTYICAMCGQNACGACMSPFHELIHDCQGCRTAYELSIASGWELTTAARSTIVT